MSQFRSHLESAVFGPAPMSRLLVRVGPVFFFALLTAVTARIAIPLPFTPVPITLQVWAVLLAGLVLGSRRGAASQIAYLAALVAGLPISTLGIGGPAVLLGPTGGYLLAFPAGAWVAGWLVERLTGQGRANPAGPYLGRRLPKKTLELAVCLLAGLCGVATIYAGGAAWLTVLLGNIEIAFRQGVLPFVWADLFKALFAAAVAGGGRLIFAPRSGSDRGE